MSILTQGFEAQACALREFGYSGVTSDDIAKDHERWKRGDTARDVVFAFNADAFKKHPAIFGVPDAR